MKVLTAENKFNRQTQAIALADIMVDEKQSVVDTAPHWACFPRHIHIATSIATEGMKNPVIVLKDGDTYKFAASAARIQFAVVNNYTHIESIVVTDEADVRPLMVEQAKTEEQYLDGRYIDRWWETETKGA